MGPRQFERAPARRLFIGGIVAVLALRFVLMSLPGYPPDLQTYKLWALVSGVRGVHTIYDSPEPYDPARLGAQSGPEAKGIDQIQANYDYPPLYAYLLAPLGWLYAAVAPDPGKGYSGSIVFTMIVKLPPLTFDLAIALLLRRAIRSRGGPGGWPSRAGGAVALLYLALPPVLFDSAYWGQPDSIHTFFVLLALLFALDGRAVRTGVALSLACLMKPLGLPFVPLVAFALLLRAGWRRTSLGALAGIGVGLLLFLPYIVTGRGPLVWDRFTGHVDLMPYTSVNAHNLWGLIGPWGNAGDSLLGPLTPKAIGLILFAVAYCLALLGVRRWERSRRDDDTWFLAGGAVAFSFFFFSTHMHENHLFTLLPFALILAGRDRPWRIWATGVTLAVLANMAIHDLELGRLLFGGGRGNSAAQALAAANSGLVALLFVAFWVLGLRRLRDQRQGTLASPRG